MTLENVVEIAVLVAIVVVAIRFFCEAGLISHVFLEHQRWRLGLSCRG